VVLSSREAKVLKFKSQTLRLRRANRSHAMSATADRQHRLHALHVLTLVSRGVGRDAAFQDIDALRRFSLPHVLSSEAR
jgi:hypothetical protein